MAIFITEIRDFIQQGKNLPTLPEVVLELHDALDNEFSSDGQIAAIVDSDPALATRMLRVANSAFYHGDRIGSVLAAIQRLGVNRVRSICVVLEIVKWSSPRQGGTGGGFDHREFWTHSAAVGYAAQAIGERLAFSRSINVSDLYMAGLLHDVGHLVMDQFFPANVQEVLDVAGDSDLPLWKVEAMVLGMDHGEVGGLLLGSWSLPKVLTDIVTNHHHPEAGSREYRDACTVVHAADVLCNGSDLGVQIEGPSEIDVVETLSSLGLAGEDLDAILSEVDVVREKAQRFLVST